MPHRSAGTRPKWGQSLLCTRPLAQHEMIPVDSMTVCRATYWPAAAPELEPKLLCQGLAGWKLNFICGTSDIMLSTHSVCQD